MGTAVCREATEAFGLDPDRLAGDKGYGSPAVGRYLKGRRIGAVIPTKADKAFDPAFDRAAYRERNAVEQYTAEMRGQ